MERIEIDDPSWLDFVGGCPASTAFHHPAWAGLLAECYRYRAFALVVRGEAGEIVAGLPVVDVTNRVTGDRWVSLPYTDACAPLSAADGVAPLGAALAEECGRRGLGVLEVRAGVAGSGASAVDAGWNHVIALSPDVDEVERRFASSVRRDIAKARKAEVTVRRAERRNDLSRTFYALHTRTRRRKGVPVQPRRYFELLWDRIVEPGLGLCLLAHGDGEPLAGVVLLGWNGTLLYKYAASDERQLAHRPNHLLLGEAIRWACANGYASLDLGRTEPGNQGLRRFKTSWGAGERPLVYSVFGAEGTRGVDGGGRAASILAPVIRRSPAAVCRLAGELLYRYAA